MDLLYELMDHELIDMYGNPCGRVDDIEVENVFDRPPRVTALVTGGGIKSSHLGRLAHRFSSWVHHLLGIEPVEPIRILWALVDHFEDDVILSAPADELQLNRVNQAVARRFIRRIPGAQK